jgi:thiol:disulfide interchange protein DsbD
MGTATGFAMSQNNAIALLVFAALGAGMAAPLTLVTFFPNAYKILPKPGGWMNTLKEFFAFPILATAIWLLWVLGNQTGSNGVGLALLGCLGLGFALWAIQKTSNTLKALGVAALIAAATVPFSEHLTATPQSYMGEHIVYSEEKLAQYRRDGQAVFIDLTADWCITCLANKKTTLETDTVQQAFKDANIIYMVGDWTNHNPEITALLSRYGRSGIPLYLLYPPIADAPAAILPQILNEQVVLDAIKNNSK